MQFTEYIVLCAKSLGAGMIALASV
uniref:Uncharacterized protein n=1 Tax=Anguilla anguilla TaxID=7936 RepID=A0A0E9QIW4_ANGAN